MNINVQKNQHFLRSTLGPVRGMLKGQKWPRKRKNEVQTLLKQLQLSSSEQKQKRSFPREIALITSPKLSVASPPIAPSVAPTPQKQETTIFTQPSQPKVALKPTPVIAVKETHQPVAPVESKNVAQTSKAPSQFISPNQPEGTLKKTVRHSSSFALRKALFVFFTISSLLLLIVLFGPALYYKVFPGDPIPVVTTETGTPLGGRFDQGTQQRTVEQPPYDPSLPDGEWLIIPRIGVDTQIQENQNSEVALEKGVWRVPDFGTAGDLSKPMILAAHRYGYIWWWKNGSQYWRYNSFYLLPQLQPGDLVDVISGKRKYVYEIYAGEQGSDITDYNADLILYTCKFLTGETRFFRYARLVDPSKDTQPSSQLNSQSGNQATPEATASATLQK